VLGVVHYWWLVKADLQRPQAYAAIMAALLGFRLAKKYQDSRSRATVKAVPASRSVRL